MLKPSQKAIVVVEKFIKQHLSPTHDGNGNGQGDEYERPGKERILEEGKRNTNNTEGWVD